MRRSLLGQTLRYAAPLAIVARPVWEQTASAGAACFIGHLSKKSHGVHVLWHIALVKQCSA